MVSSLLATVTVEFREAARGTVSRPGSATPGSVAYAQAWSWTGALERMGYSPPPRTTRMAAPADTFEVICTP